MSEKRISLCMIVRDEAKHLADCLRSVCGCVDEVVVVDTGSRDESVAIATSWGAQVIHEPWRGDFAQARNCALAHARGAWVLSLDADERLAPEGAAALRKLADDQEPEVAFTMVVVSRLPDGQEIAMRPVRFFPNRPDVRFERPVHEEVRGALARAHVPILDSGIVIEHVGYLSPEALVAKHRRNRDIIDAALRGGGAMDPLLSYYGATSRAESGNWVEAAEAFEAVARMPAASGLQVREAAWIKAAEAWLAAGEPDRAEAALKEVEGGQGHPRECELRATLAERRGDSGAARDAWERLARMDEAPRLPPVAWPAAKARALYWLADYWAGRGETMRAGAVRVLADACKAGKSKTAGGEYGRTVAGDRV